MTDMIEKKRTAYEKARSSPDRPKPYERDEDEVWLFWEGWNACLSALEEPSEEMVRAGTAKMGQAFLHGAPHAIVAQHTFNAMIKAAKGEE